MADPLLMSKWHSLEMIDYCLKTRQHGKVCVPLAHFDYCVVSVTNTLKMAPTAQTKMTAFWVNPIDPKRVFAIAGRDPPKTPKDKTVMCSECFKQFKVTLTAAMCRQCGDWICHECQLGLLSGKYVTMDPEEPDITPNAVYLPRGDCDQILTNCSRCH